MVQVLASRDLVHLEGVLLSILENMLLRSHLTLICHGERSRADAPCRPLAHCELFIASLS